jgi:hypothetical protein
VTVARTLHPDILAEVERNKIALDAKSGATHRINALEANDHRLEAAVDSLRDALDDHIRKIPEHNNALAVGVIKGVEDAYEARLARMEAALSELQTKNFPSRGRLTLVDAKDRRDATG